LTGKAFSSPTPYLILAGICLAAPVGNRFFPAFFYPVFAPWGVALVGGLAAIAASARAWFLYRAIGKRRKNAMVLMKKILQGRDSKTFLSGSSADRAGRTLGRVLRNTDEDLREMRPDFTVASLERLSGFLPELLDEIKSETDAAIRLGIVGAYLGETACRLWGWQWNFRADPSLRQFDYLASALERKGARMDPFELAGELFSGTLKPKELIQRFRESGGETA
jgi:hypothetical protein